MFQNFVQLALSSILVPNYKAYGIRQNWSLKVHILKNHMYKNLTLLPQQNSQHISWIKYPGHGKLLDYRFRVFLGLVLCYPYYYPGIIGTASFVVIVTAAGGLLIGYLEKRKEDN